MPTGEHHRHLPGHCRETVSGLKDYAAGADDGAGVDDAGAGANDAALAKLIGPSVDPQLLQRPLRNAHVAPAPRGM